MHCKELFLPDYRGGQRQCYCLKPDCRKARKRELMRAWLAKPENQDYFRDDQNAQRARDWQKEHPGYWKNTARCRRRTLQDGCSEQAPAAQEVAKNASDCSLQDLRSMQVHLFVGLSPCSSAVPYQTTSPPVIKGHDILGMVPGMNLERLLHEKRILNPERLRKVPPQFSWIDHRLVQENYFLRCDHLQWLICHQPFSK